MAKIQRKTQKIFAGNTTSDQITAFGTAKNTNPVYTTDLDAIQTDVYAQGWTPSLMSDLAPYLQDSNALWYLVTSQLAYLFQQGIAEWDVNTEYTQGSIVSKYNNDDLEIYLSLQNNNIGNQLTETSYWKRYSFNTLLDKMNKDFSNATSQPWNDRLKTDLSNMPATQKTNISGWAMPNYGARWYANVTTWHNATTNAWLHLQTPFIDDKNYPYLEVRYNGVTERFTCAGNTTATENIAWCVTAAVPKGGSFYFYAGNSGATLSVIPCVGG